jgi:hypothetical protein
VGLAADSYCFSGVGNQNLSGLFSRPLHPVRAQPEKKLGIPPMQYANTALVRPPISSSAALRRSGDVHQARAEFTTLEANVTRAGVS